MVILIFNPKFVHKIIQILVLSLAVMTHSKSWAEETDNSGVGWVASAAKALARHQHLLHIRPNSFRPGRRISGEEVLSNRRNLLLTFIGGRPGGADWRDRDSFHRRKP